MIRSNVVKTEMREVWDETRQSSKVPLRLEHRKQRKEYFHVHDVRDNNVVCLIILNPFLYALSS